jgi:hypothetical protein
MSLVAGQDAENNQTIPRDELFDILSSHRRRYALHAIKQTEGEVALSDLAEQVAAWENEKQLSEITSDERHSVYTSLQQLHLPMMDRAGVIAFERGAVAATEQTAALDLYIDVVPENSIPWGEYYLGLSVISFALVSAVSFSVIPATVPAPVWMGLIVALFLCSALYHTWQNRRYQVGNADSPPEVRT